MRSSGCKCDIGLEFSFALSYSMYQQLFLGLVEYNNHRLSVSQSLLCILYVKHDGIAIQWFFLVV